MSIKLIGEQALIAALEGFSLDVKMAVDDAVRTTAFKVLSTAVKSIQNESPGKTRRSAESGKLHVASKPGDAPNTDTGRLAGSIQVWHNKGSQIAFVGSNLDYAKWLEEDLDRPFLNPAKDAESEKFISRISDAINAQIKKAEM